MNAADIMTSDVVRVSPDTKLTDLARIMLDNRVSAVPVEQDGRIVGIVSEGDLLRRVETGTERRPSWLELFTSSHQLAAEYVHSHGRTAGEVMTTQVISVADTTPIAEIAEILESNRIKRVPVLRDGKLVGIVSRANLLQALACRIDAPAAAASDDLTIRQTLYDELRRQPWAIGPMQVNIVVQDATVHLWGSVDDAATHQAIVLAAKNTQGVREVEDHLKARAESDPLSRPHWQDWPAEGRL
jgi:CBS domain-containing protein